MANGQLIYKREEMNQWHPVESEGDTGEGDQDNHTGEKNGWIWPPKERNPTIPKN